MVDAPPEDHAPAATAQDARRRQRGVHATDRAFGTATAILSFLLVAKLCLLLWNLWIRGRSPIADLPTGGTLLLVAPDLLLCLALACILHPLYRADAWAGGRFRWPALLARTLLCAGVVGFTVVSFQVARIYGEPLDVVLLRSADDLMVLRSSMFAYLEPLAMALLAYGAICLPLLSRPIALRLAERRWLVRPYALWCVAAVVAIGMTGLQRLRLGGVDTFGVKNNAIVYFVQQYRRPLRPVDAPAMIREIESRAGRDLLATQLPPSLVVPGRSLARDFAAPAAGAARGFNVILVQLESTSAMHVDVRSAPHVTALAERGLAFDRHFTTVTYTARASYSLHYSDHLPEIGTTPRLLYGKPMPQPALAEVMRSAGYQTGVFATSFIDYLDLRFLFERKGVDQLTAAREMVDAGRAKLVTSSGVREEDAVDALCDWIATLQGKPFFATWLTESPHHPYVSFIDDAPFANDTWLGRYKNSLHYTDAAVGRLVERLRERGLLERTLIVLVGDHGETASVYPVGHGLRVSLEETRTPFIVSNSLLFPIGAASSLYTSHLDVAPTLVRLLGLEAPPHWLGRDLLAERLPAQLQFVTLPQTRQLAVIDNGLLFARDGSRGGRLFEINDATLAALDPADVAWRDRAASYRRSTDWFEDWALLRHLVRAQAGTDDAAAMPPAARFSGTPGMPMIGLMRDAATQDPR